MCVRCLRWSLAQLQTLTLDFVSDCRSVWFTCSTSLWGQEPSPCRRPLRRPGGSSASSSSCSWGLWGRMWEWAWGERGIQLRGAGRTVWMLLLLLCVILPLCRSSVGLCACIARGPCLEGCIFWPAAIQSYIPSDWWGRLFLQHTVSWDLSPSFLFGHHPPCGCISHLPLPWIHFPTTNQVPGDTGSFLCALICRCDADLLY